MPLSPCFVGMWFLPQQKGYVYFRLMEINKIHIFQNDLIHSQYHHIHCEWYRPLFSPPSIICWLSLPSPHHLCCRCRHSVDCHYFHHRCRLSTTTTTSNATITTTINIVIATISNTPLPSPMLLLPLPSQRYSSYCYYHRRQQSIDHYWCHHHCRYRDDDTTTATMMTFTVAASITITVIPSSSAS